MRPGYLQMLLLTGPGLSLVCCYPHEPLGNSFQMWTATHSNESSYLHISPPPSPPTKQKQTAVMSKPPFHQWNTCPWKRNHKTATKQGRNNTTILLCQAYLSFCNSSSPLTTTPLLTKSMTSLDSKLQPQSVLELVWSLGLRQAQCYPSTRDNQHLLMFLIGLQAPWKKGPFASTLSLLILCWVSKLYIQLHSITPPANRSISLIWKMPAIDHAL